MQRLTGTLLPNVNRRTVLAGAAAAGGSLILPAMARAQDAQPVSGGTLRAAMPYNPAALDPLTGRNNPDFNTLFTIYDALIDFDPETLELKPMLAKSWEFKDPTTLVLELVEGVEFHDGEPFNAEAVVFHLDRCKNYARSNVKSDVASIETVEATGPYQVTIKTKRADASLPAVLSDRPGCIVSPKSVKEAADGNVDRTPVGTGPFKFVEWKDNDLITVERNPNYWGDAPYLDKIELRIISELNTAARTVMAGQSDLAMNLGAQQIVVAKREDSVVAEAPPSMIYYTSFLNYKDGPLADVKVRQAMNWALNREDLNRVLMSGLGQAHCSMFPSGFWANDPETEHYYTHDLDKAKALLAEAGHPNGIEIDSWGWPDQASMQRQELLSSQLAEAGIRVKITPAPPAQAMQNFLTDKKGYQLFSPTGGLPDPSITYDRQFSATAYRNAGNIELDGYRPLLDASLSTFDQAGRQKVLFDLQRFVLENALHLPQYLSAGMTIRTKNVNNFVFGLLNRPRFHKVWLSKSA